MDTIRPEVVCALRLGIEREAVCACLDSVLIGHAEDRGERREPPALRPSVDSASGVPRSRRRVPASDPAARRSPLPLRRAHAEALRWRQTDTRVGSSTSSIRDRCSVGAGTSRALARAAARDQGQARSGRERHHDVSRRSSSRTLSCPARGRPCFRPWRRVSLSLTTRAAPSRCFRNGRERFRRTDNERGREDKDA